MNTANSILENYFEQQVSLPEEAPVGGYTVSERAFLERYLGSDFEASLDRQGLTRPAVVESVSGPLASKALAAPEAPASPDSSAEAASVEAALRQARELKLVGFRTGGQELAVPIAQVQEVIRAVPPTRLPAAPPHICGIMNLRGRVVPLVDMAGLMDLSRTGGENRFIIVCRRGDMQLGLMVEAIAAMHQAYGEDVEWGVEARIGVAPVFISGLLKVGDALVKILSIDSLFQKVLKS